MARDTMEASRNKSQAAELEQRKDESSAPGKKPGTTSGNDDYGSTEREPDDGHARVDEQKPHL